MQHGNSELEVCRHRVRDLETHAQIMDEQVERDAKILRLESELIRTSSEAKDLIQRIISDASRGAEMRLSGSGRGA